ncbi:MAG: hypothetical protein LH647_05425 [Leptolyngbyaceae cyanobacterium CAN_BIN12]|nr:hypothetical protein [Leptolyngbyaceae cyanobacterium CAN_BIN12]
MPLSRISITAAQGRYSEKNSDRLRTIGFGRSGDRRCNGVNRCLTLDSQNIGRDRKIIP